MSALATTTLTRTDQALREDVLFELKYDPKLTGTSDIAVAVKDGEGWKINAAGPTTSIREEPYQADVIGRYGVRAVIGKGGMGPKTLAALKEHGAVYLNGFELPFIGASSIPPAIFSPLE